MQLAILSKKYTFAQLMKESRWILYLLGLLNLFFGSLMLLFYKLGWQGAKLDYTFIFPGILYSLAGYLGSFWFRAICICIWIIDLGYASITSKHPKYWQIIFVCYAVIFIYKMIKYRKVGATPISFEKLNIDLSKFALIRLVPRFSYFIKLEWAYHSLFTLLFIVGGFIAPIIKVIHRGNSFYVIPLFAAIWFGLMWLIFYGLGWLFIGSNFPKEIRINETEATLNYSLKWLNKTIKKDVLILSHSIVLGLPMLLVKNRNKLKGISILEYMYLVSDRTEDQR